MIIALIPLRGGSKSIPKKNIKLMAGKPLCAWTLESAYNSGIFDKVVVSTDSQEIADVVRSLNLDVEIIMRPAELATDTSSTESVMLHIADIVDFDVIVTIQATSPLTEPLDFVNAYKKFNAENLDSLVTGVNQKRFYWDIAGTPLSYDPLNRPRRQDYNGVIMENGAFYITKRSVLTQSQCRLGGRIGIYEMPENTAIEIDELSDWHAVEKLIKLRQEATLHDSLKGVKLVAVDVDGVLTDSGMYYDETGKELKKFNTRDGKGIELLRERGIKTAIITGESSTITDYRAQKIKADFVYKGIQDKGAVICELALLTGIDRAAIAYIGDDLNDLSAFQCVGISVCPADAVESIKTQADLVLSKNGGQGVVRELADLILKE
ncbi:MAG: acylneuraminate cytidylyltransferase [Candidatus Margulisiibacteriota bacterium]|nr:MAG: acylneuraminate cytidylyltransferase [Candidatus Margulisiibacteriota bacterium]HCT86558.1 acylneuraminate cytidylyltransferase [Candidatus Margulisiibacteriota bacterium]HCY35668.1 acylneuraminate cytidylyltransferase [Candidatus Margulisiibacteriota bacterium]